MLGILYFAICLIGILAHMSNYQKILESDTPIHAKPSTVLDMEGYQYNNRIIEVINIIDIVLIGIMISDLVTKIINHCMVIKAIFSVDNKKDDSFIYFDEPLTFDPLKNDGGLFVIKTDYIVMDFVLVTAIIMMYAIQTSLASSGQLNYLHLGILMMGRGFFKLPFAVAIIQFMIKVKQIRTQ